MAAPVIHIEADLNEILSDFMPKLAGEFINLKGPMEELAGTEFSLVVDMAGVVYSYKVADGKDLTVEEGGMDQPMVKISMDLEDLQNLLLPKNIDMILGLHNELSREKYEVLSKLAGQAVFKITNENGSVSLINAVFNAADTPTATLLMGMGEARAILTKENNPVQLFMTGGLKIEGDIAFAMALQPIFT